MRSAFCQCSVARPDEEDEGTDAAGRGQNTACPSVPAVTRSEGERMKVCVRHDVEYIPRAKGRQRGVRVGV